MIVCFYPKVLLLNSVSRSELRWVVETKNSTPDPSNIPLKKYESW